MPALKVPHGCALEKASLRVPVLNDTKKEKKCNSDLAQMGIKQKSKDLCPAPLAKTGVGSFKTGPAHESQVKGW